MRKIFGKGADSGFVGPEVYAVYLFKDIHNIRSPKLERSPAGFPGARIHDFGRIPALWEAEADRTQGQEFETSLTNMEKPRLY